MSLLRLAAALTAFALLATSCGDDDDDAETGGTGGGGTSGLSREEREQKVLDDAGDLEALLNTFWTSELTTTYSITFDSPDGFASYRGEDNEPCGPDHQAYPRNATYCAVDSSEIIQFDLDWFQEYLIDHPGGATTFLILAHEWGHAVQDTWLETGGADIWNPAYRKELNADCLAGVFLQHEIDSGSIIEEDGDAEAIFGWLYQQGSTDWLGTPGSHGTQDQRLEAFSDGFTKGTDYCRVNY